MRIPRTAGAPRGEKKLDTVWEQSGCRGPRRGRMRSEVGDAGRIGPRGLVRLSKERVCREDV